MDSLIEVVLELIFQIVGDFILDAVSRSKNPLVHSIANSILAAFFAAFLSFISLQIHPRHIIQYYSLRITMLITLPILNGFLMLYIGQRHVRSGRIRSDFERFLPGFVFSFIFGAIRFLCAK